MIDTFELANYIQQRERTKQLQKAREQKELKQSRARNCLILLGLIALILIAGLLTYEHNVRAYTFTNTTTHLVQAGDTLWNIARDAQTSTIQDVRQIVFIIQELNDLDSSVIFPRQILEIPVFDSTPP